MGIRKVVAGAGILASGAAAGYVLVARPWSRVWGVDPDEASQPMSGDELVADPSVSDTRGIDVAAPPEAVWPWLVQMGFGRAGWYSYDAIDMRGRSADRILPEFQSLELDALVPNSAETAFVVKGLEPGRALVLYFDDDLVKEQLAAARSGTAGGTAPEGTPANLRAASSVMPSMPGFKASWAFELHRRDDGGTRLIERLRFSAEGGRGARDRLMFEAFGFGVFLMVRRQMLGLRDRAERSSWHDFGPELATAG